MTEISKKTKYIFFGGLIYSLLITVTALVFSLIGNGLLPYAAKELVFIASEVLSFAIIFAFFAEFFTRRFER